MQVDVVWFYGEVGGRIQKARKDRRMSQESLARRVGLTRTSITNIEKGRQKTLVHTLWSIAGELGVGVEELLPSMKQPLEEALKEYPTQVQRDVRAALESRGEG